MLDLLHAACWAHQITNLEGGIGYIGAHAHGESLEWYPGACQLIIQRGRQRGHARYPKRHAEHQQLISSPQARDGELQRYQLWRELDPDRTFFFPRVFDTARYAFNGEHHIIRRMRPVTTENTTVIGDEGEDNDRIADVGDKAIDDVISRPELVGAPRAPEIISTIASTT